MKAATPIKQLENRRASGIPAETVSYSMSLGNGGEWALPADQIGYLDASTVSGEMTLTSRPPLDISRYIRELYAYPYGCLEQTVSGLYPSLYSSEAELKKLGIKTQTDAGRRQAVMTGIPHLLGMQRSDGSFSCGITAARKSRG